MKKDETTEKLDQLTDAAMWFFGKHINKTLDMEIINKKFYSSLMAAASRHIKGWDDKPK